MKNYLILLTISIISMTALQNSHAQTSGNSLSSNTALIIIDIQEFYFPGGMLPLVEPEKAAKNAQKLLKQFRKEQRTIIHVKHNVSSGADIHELVAPIEGEKVIPKDKANAFVGTDLLEYLKDNKIENLVLCGMQTHMCLEAATRAASDYGFKCTVVEDACTTRDLKFGDITIHAKDVHYSTLSTLQGTYAEIIKTEDFIDHFAK